MLDWWTEYAGDILWVGSGVAALLSYQIHLTRCERRNPDCTIQGVNRAARRAWIHHIMADPNHGLLAVQTLRNSTMAATFFG